jgi:tetratricopeptide (TPR) repeat protein
VGEPGLEPGTSVLSGLRSNQLSYTPSRLYIITKAGGIFKLNTQYNLSYHFDADLRDVPDAPDDMRAYIDAVQEQLASEGLPSAEQLRLLGTIGVYVRMLGELDWAVECLQTALALAEQIRDKNSFLANKLRLANVYQWQRRFEEADSLFTDAIALSRDDPDLSDYLDFAYQHYGKSLFDQGRFPEAERAFLEALILRQAKGDDTLIQSTQYALEVTRSWLGQ